LRKSIWRGIIPLAANESDVDLSLFLSILFLEGRALKVEAFAENFSLVSELTLLTFQ